MLITLMFSVIAKESRTFSSLPYPASEQVCRIWEGAQPGSQPMRDNGNIPYQRRHAQFMDGGWQECSVFFLFAFSPNTLWSRSLNFSGSSVIFRSFAKFAESASSGFCDCCSGTGYELVTGQ